MTSVEIDSDAEMVNATFVLDANVGVSEFSLGGPHRYVIDFASTVPAAGLSLPTVSENSMLRGIRQGLHADGRLRIVFDLAAPATLEGGVFAEDTPSGAYRIRLTLNAEAPRESDEATASVPAEDASAADMADSPIAQRDTSPSSGIAAQPTEDEGFQGSSMVFGSSSSASAPTHANAMGNSVSGLEAGTWVPRLTRGLVEPGVLVADESRTSGNFHIQAVGTLTRSLNNSLDLRLGARLDAQVQGGEVASYDFTELDYDESWLRYHSGNLRLTLGAQRIIWGRADEISPTDRLSTRDLTRFILDDLPNRRRANPAARLEFTRDDWAFDLVYLPLFREAEMPGLDSIWSPISRERREVAGLPLPPESLGMFEDVVLENDASGDGGGGLRVSRFGDNLDFALTVQRVKNPEPYLSLAGTVAPGVALVEAVYPRTWVVGGDFGAALGAWTVRFEGAWLSDAPYTATDFTLQTSDAVNWVLGGDVSPGDRDTRLTLQLVGMHLLDAEEAIDRENTLGLTGAIETPLPDRRWRARIRWWLGLNRRDDYINPELVFSGWEPSEIYLGMNIFSGDRGTLGDYYRQNIMVVLGWRGRF
ncbi:MAG: DUF1302 family protein [Pseudomonadota bacterium]